MTELIMAVIIIHIIIISFSIGYIKAMRYNRKDLKQNTRALEIIGKIPPKLGNKEKKFQDILDSIQPQK